MRAYNLPVWHGPDSISIRDIKQVSSRVLHNASDSVKVLNGPQMTGHLP
jgi:hypothetical protein